MFRMLSRIETKAERCHFVPWHYLFVKYQTKTCSQNGSLHVVRGPQTATKGLGQPQRASGLGSQAAEDLRKPWVLKGLRRPQAAKGLGRFQTMENFGLQKALEDFMLLKALGTQSLHPDFVPLHLSNQTLSPPPWPCLAALPSPYVCLAHLCPFVLHPLYPHTLSTLIPMSCTPCTHLFTLYTICTHCYHVLHI